MRLHDRERCQSRSASGEWNVLYSTMRMEANGDGLQAVIQELRKEGEALGGSTVEEENAR